VFHKERNSILLVDREGVLVELDLDLREKNRWTLTGDLEGVAVNPTTGRILLASERDSRLTEFDLDSGKELQRYVVALGSHPEFLEDRNPDRGIEGVAFANPGNTVTVFVVHEISPPRLLRLELNLAMVADSAQQDSKTVAGGSSMKNFAMVHKGWDPGLRSLNDLAFDVTTQTFLITSAREKMLAILDASGKPLRSYDLPGPSPKGFCLLPNGDALVVHEAGGGQVIPDFRATLFPTP